MPGQLRSRVSTVTCRDDAKLRSCTFGPDNGRLLCGVTATIQVASKIAQVALFVVLHPLVLCLAVAELEAVNLAEFLRREALASVNDSAVLFVGLVGLYVPVYCCLSALLLVKERA